MFINAFNDTGTRKMLGSEALKGRSAWEETLRCTFGRFVMLTSSDISSLFTSTRSDGPLSVVPFDPSDAEPREGFPSTFLNHVSSECVVVRGIFFPTPN